LVVRRFLRESLEHYGYRVLECSSGFEAMERARHYPASIHLLLTDLVMPGLLALNWLRSFRLAIPVFQCCVSPAIARSSGREEPEVSSRSPSTRRCYSRASEPCWTTQNFFSPVDGGR
jgi:CheY-like chemotaxis protein